MGNSQVFDYDQPTHDTLAGVYVEASDEVLPQGAVVDAGSGSKSAPAKAELFGLTLTANDIENGKPFDGRPTTTSKFGE